MNLGKGSPWATAIVLNCVCSGIIALLTAVVAKGDEPPRHPNPYYLVDDVQNFPAADRELASQIAPSTAPGTESRQSDPRYTKIYPLEELFEAVRLPNRHQLNRQQQRIAAILSEIADLSVVAQHNLDWRLTNLTFAGTEAEHDRLSSAIEELRFNSGRNVIFNAWILNGSRERIGELTAELDWKLLPGAAAEEAPKSESLLNIDRPALRFSTDHKAACEVKTHRNHPVATALIDRESAATLVRDLKADENVKLVVSPSMITQAGVPATLVSEAQRPFVVGVRTASHQRQPVIEFLPTGLEIQLLPWFRSEQELHLNSMWGIRDVGSVDQASYNVTEGSAPVTLQSPQYNTTLLTADLNMNVDQSLVFHLPSSAGNSDQSSLVVLSFQPVVERPDKSTEESQVSPKVSDAAGSCAESGTTEPCCQQACNRCKPARTEPEVVSRPLQTLPAADWKPAPPPAAPAAPQQTSPAVSDVLPAAWQTSLKEAGISVRPDSLRRLNVTDEVLNIEAQVVRCSFDSNGQELNFVGQKLAILRPSSVAAGQGLRIHVSGNQTQLEGSEIVNVLTADNIECEIEAVESSAKHPFSFRVKGNVKGTNDDIAIKADSLEMKAGVWVLSGNASLSLPRPDEGDEETTLRGDRIEINDSLGAIIVERSPRQ